MSNKKSFENLLNIYFIDTDVWSFLLLEQAYFSFINFQIPLSSVDITLYFKMCVIEMLRSWTDLNFCQIPFLT